jgi:heterodisulfide reductase subunit A-like polyferredoxin
MSGHESILVVGGGISGLTAAVEAAEVGYDVHLVEKSSYLGGRVARLNQYFPKLCPPYCGLEINFRRIRQNPRITTYTQAEVTNIEGKAGAYKVTIALQPRLVSDACTACDACTAVCPVERDDEFNYGIGKTKAIFRPHPMSFPLRYAIDTDACEGETCGKCVGACPFKAIDIGAKAQETVLEVGAIVVATGWQPYDAARLEHLGGASEPDVITNVVMERLASPNGPTGGTIARPSDGKPISSIAFVQCAGSRDENHLPYCSGVCCLAALKQATYVRSQHPDARIYFFYIDIRAPGRNEDFYAQVARDEKLTLRRGKVAKVTRKSDGTLLVEAEDTASNQKTSETVDLVVLATGMQPSHASSALPGDLECDDYGFLAANAKGNGVFSAGCAKNPVDVATSVQDATAAALKAIRTIAAGRVA